MPGSPRFDAHHDHLTTIRGALLCAADPAPALRAATPDSILLGRTLVLAVGKASLAMARAVASSVPTGSVRGLILAPESILPDVPPLPSFSTFPVDHPLPTTRNVAATAAAEREIDGMRPGDRLLVLLSGGASAHLCAPCAPLTVEHLAALTRDLLLAGAPIGELNSIRRNLERFKGGGLAQFAESRGVSVRSLILSDVIGDPLQDIASGPTTSNPTSPAEALAILEGRSLTTRHRAVSEFLRDRARSPWSPRPVHARNTIIASNDDAVEAAARAAIEIGFSTVIVRRRVIGPAADAGRSLASEAAALRASGVASFAIIAGGETTVSLAPTAGSHPPPPGGRNQELALAAAIALAGTPRVALVSLATDGVDGLAPAPPVAGAIVTGQTVSRARDRQSDPFRALADHESYRFFHTLGDHVTTGPTGTNVCDVQILLAYPP